MAVARDNHIKMHVIVYVENLAVPPEQTPIDPSNGCTVATNKAMSMWNDGQFIEDAGLAAPLAHVWLTFLIMFINGWVLGVCWWGGLPGPGQSLRHCQSLYFT